MVSGGQPTLRPTGMGHQICHHKDYCPVLKKGGYIGFQGGLGKARDGCLGGSVV